MNRLSERRLAENELVFRHSNLKNKNRQQRKSSTDDSQLLLDFYCECSNLDCRERITLTASDYEKAHRNNSQFAALPGHENPSIEKVLTTEGHYNVVEKYTDPSELVREMY